MGVLILAALLRMTGLMWGENTYNHPDERFLLFVGTDIKPVESIREYWDTENSTLNPHNRGHRFYVYGTLPMFLVRYVVEWQYGHSGINEVLSVGRTLSALFDLLTVFIVFLIGAHLYGRRVGLLASAFSAFAVLQIQQAHFFTMDTFTTFFAILAIYFAVKVANSNRELGERKVDEGDSEDSSPSILFQIRKFTSHHLFLLCVGFGVAMGMALASKVNSAPVAFLLPIAMLIRLSLIPSQYRRPQFHETLIYVALAAAVSFFVFRIFQPYAFMGPGFWGLRPNMDWIENLQSLARMAAGDVDFPPAIQWARRPVWFAWQNLVLFGMGLPLGLLAWTGFLAIAWKMIKGAWQWHVLLWGWTAVYFTWQSLVFNPSMRYQLLVYPTLVIFAAWMLVQLYDSAKAKENRLDTRIKDGLIKTWWLSTSGIRVRRALVVVIGLFVLIVTAGYAYAFTGIYTSPLTRAEASRWIFQNIPGPINLQIQTSEGVYNQPVPYPYGLSFDPNSQYNTTFQPKVDGTLREVNLPHVIDNWVKVEFESLTAIISPVSDTAGFQGTAEITESQFIVPREAGEAYSLSIKQPVNLIEGEPYSLRFELPVENPSLRFCGPIVLNIYTPDGIVEQSVNRPPGCLIQARLPYQTIFTPRINGSLLEITFNEVSVERTLPDSVVVNLTITDQPELDGPLAVTSATFDPTKAQLYPGKGVLFSFDQPIHLVQGSRYYLELRVETEGQSLLLMGTAVANEGAWDDGLPFRVDGYDGFGGIYQPDFNFDMYETDNPAKLARFLRIIDQTEYIFISSNRQWGSLPRLPERFPMNTEYFRLLLGCPPEHSIEWCYNIARPGRYQGYLGFELIKVFHAKPNVGPISINTQFAEEAFTVYDHPKVFIFKKGEDFNPEQVRLILGGVDLSEVVHVTPKQAGALPQDIMLPADQLIEHQEGGTWLQLFDSQALHNRWPMLGVFVWYLAVAALGLVAYPVVRLALSGLPDRGYPLARTSGLLIASYLVWIAGSSGVPFTRTTITVVLVVLLSFSAFLGIHQRKELRAEWNSNRRYYLMIEALFLAFFVAGLLIRMGNPDLWHPSKGGEKPMDFSYFNAVLKSSSFPPYDPWFAGGYINYYYYGFVLVGVLVKWLGIVPATAINLILPTIFSLIAMGAFSIAWNLFTKHQIENNDSDGNGRLTRYRISAFIPAIGAALGMGVLGNLGTARMIYHGLQRLGAPGGVIDDAGLVTQLYWASRGLIQSLLGSGLPYSLGDWYWIPSRAIPVPAGEVQPITEFPLFTVLYADPHAHLFALPLTLLALAWAVSVVFGRSFSNNNTGSKWNKNLTIGLSFLIGGLAIGVLRPTNTWDLPTYLALGVLAIAYSIGRDYPIRSRLVSTLNGIPAGIKRGIIAIGSIVVLLGLSFMLFQPYTYWYVQGYTAAELWQGSHTPFWSYLTHWGLFLFVLVGWMLWETRQWMASTPLSSLRKLAPYRGLIIGTGIVLLLVILLFHLIGIGIAWLALLMAAWAGILILRPTMPDTKRVVLFLVGTGLVLTLLVEVVRLQGDIGRMNTVFKFYLQTWTLFSVSAATALGWLVVVLPQWRNNWRKIWSGVLMVLILAASLFPLTAIPAKVKDRMAPQAPRGLDGMAFMQFATYHDADKLMDLSQDYSAIRWLQENVEGSPVIVEANTSEYRWGTRFTIYTGLPNVIGWNWHQRQQRADMHEDVWSRVGEVNDFYRTVSVDEAVSFLDQYGIQFIIVGQLERAYYSGPGLTKFDQFDGHFWEAVYRDKETVIYEVRREGQ